MAEWAAEILFLLQFLKAYLTQDMHLIAYREGLPHSHIEFIFTVSTVELPLKALT